MGHRIWQGSTTSYNIDNKIREKEDLEIMETLWPFYVQKIIVFYGMIISYFIVICKTD